MGLGPVLRNLRKQKKLSIYDVWNLTGIHFVSLSRYERGLRRPGRDTMAKLAACYDTTPHAIYEAAELTVAEGAALQEALEKVRRLRHDQMDRLHAFLDELLAPRQEAPADDHATGLTNPHQEA